MPLVIILLAVVVALIVVVVMRRNRSTNSVDSFRRHIDALGPEARRTTVDQVQSAAARNAGDDETVDEPGEPTPTDETQSSDDTTDEGGARGT